MCLLSSVALLANLPTSQVPAMTDIGNSSSMKPTLVHSRVRRTRVIAVLSLLVPWKISAAERESRFLGGTLFLMFKPLWMDF